MKSANRRMTGLIFCVGGIATVLPFLLPAASVLAETPALIYLGLLVPAAAKAASVASYPHVVSVYFSLMLILAPITAVLYLVKFESWQERFALLKLRLRTKFQILSFCFASGALIAGLIALIYIFPGNPSVDLLGSRGQLFLSIALTSRLGLAVFGGIFVAGVFLLWMLLLMCLGQFVHQMRGVFVG